MMRRCAPPNQAMERTRGETGCSRRALVAAGRSSPGRSAAESLDAEIVFWNLTTHPT